MIKHSKRWIPLAIIATLAATGAWAQNSLPANPAVPATPNAETPPNGIARGVVPPPKVDPEMVTPPPQGDKPTMPIIKPPVMAK